MAETTTDYQKASRRRTRATSLIINDWHHALLENQVKARAAHA